MQYLNITESTLQVLRTQIISGKLPGGQRLNENRLAAELGVSRPPLREAFRILANERLVVNVPRIGTFVSELSIDNFKQIAEIRLLVESFAIRQLGAMNRRALPEVEKILDTQHGITVPERFRDEEEKFALFTQFADFHLQLVEAAENAYLSHWYRGLSHNMGRYQYMFLFQPGNIAKDLEDHVHLLTLINAGRFEAAEGFLRAHLEFQRSRMIATLEAMADK